MAETGAAVARLAALAGRSTCRLTHLGRRTGTAYEVTIWFVLDGADVYLATANAKRQWVRNVRARPAVVLRVGPERFSGVAEEVRDAAGRRRATDLLARKYWYLRPALALARLAGFDPGPDAVFRVRLA